MEKKNTIKDLENTQKVHENSDSPKQETDNPHDKGYKRIFSIKKNFLDFIKKYIGFDWMMELTEKDLELIDKEFITELFGNYAVDFEYVLVSIKNLDTAQIRQSNTLVDNIFLADKKRTRKEWTENMSELLQRIREMETEDLNEWITWFSNVIRKLNEEERTLLIEQIRKGDERLMCSSFERLLMKENAQGRKQGKIEGKIEAVLELLEELGEPSETLRKYIMEQTDLELLSKWHKIAARTESIEEFEESIGLVQLQ